jgi:hypothetical protein
MTVDHREAGTAYPVFSEFRYMTDDPREAGTFYPRFSVDKQFLLLYDHPSCKKPH